MRRRCAQFLLVLCAVLLAGCRRDAPKSATDTVGATTVAQRAVAPGGTTWAPDLGQLLVVPADTESAAIVLYPMDPPPALIASSRTLLLNPSGDSARVRLAASDSQQCDAPVVHVTGSPPPSWTIGSASRSATVIRTDSIEAWPSADSAQLVIALARLSSGLQSTGATRFTGLPFAVVSARHFVLDGRDVVAAHLVRRLNQEAAPLEERTFLIAERATSSAPKEPYSAAFSERSEGTEDTAEHFDIIGAFRGLAGPLLVLARDQLAGTTYDILERTNEGWRVRWSRALKC